MDEQEKTLEAPAAGLALPGPTTGYVRCRYSCCDRPPTYTDGIGDDPCPEHGRHSLMEWIEDASASEPPKAPQK